MIDMPDIPLMVGAYRGKSLVSRLIRFQTRGVYSHVSLIAPRHFGAMAARGGALGKVVAVEAWATSLMGGAVMARRDLDEGHTPGTQIDVFEVLDIADPVMACSFAAAQVAAPYDMGGVLKFVSRRVKKPKGAGARRWFCSELVTAACAAGGVNLLERVEPWRVAPEHVVWSPQLRQVGTYVTGEGWL